jgi:hypothetical protein
MREKVSQWEPLAVWRISYLPAASPHPRTAGVYAESLGCQLILAAPFFYLYTRGVKRPLVQACLNDEEPRRRHRSR